MRTLPLSMIVTIMLFSGSSGAALGSGSQIVFVSTVSLSGPKVFVMSADGSNVHRIGSLPGWHASPAFSPDNRKIVFTYSEDIGSQDQLYLMNADGSAVVKLTNQPGGHSGAEFTQDGRIVYWQGDSSYVMNIDGSNKRPFPISAPGLGKVGAGAFGPNGMIAFAFPMWVYGHAAQLYTMTVGGLRLRSLTNSTESIMLPAWSPDGASIAFANVGAESHHEHDGIYIVNGDGTHLRRLVPFDFGQALWPSNFGIGGSDLPGLSGPPSFSPDGRSLTYAIQFGGRACIIYVVNVDGTGLHRLTDPAGFNANPSFSH
ncbi:MAG TPA: hypothetical protein VHB47_17175 [Thermoanaerobaculia bacterium]|jgi:Tol biopolymer transport system component|nr:hypothetical protein [Thermoanaerobaculia bacterium]